MRSIYFNDQTQAFIDKPFDIVFLGNLYLKGKPYTNPKEAVDKEYVDNQWDNVTEAQLTKTRFNPKNFPGFNADLVNKEGTNNFLLKELIRAGRYHKVTLDNRGRVLGGRTGKIKLDSSDFGGISYSKLHYRRYKNTDGVIGKPSKIADYTHNLNTNNYLYKAKNVHINRPLRLESGPVTEHNIINEDEMLNISDQYFIGKISGQKEKSFYGYGDWGNRMREYKNINLDPSIFQRSFTRGIANQVGKSHRTLTSGESGLVGSYRMLLIENKLAFIPMYGWNDTNENICHSIKLNSDGSLPKIANLVSNKVNVSLRENWYIAELRGPRIHVNGKHYVNFLIWDKFPGRVSYHNERYHRVNMTRDGKVTIDEEIPGHAPVNGGFRTLWIENVGSLLTEYESPTYYRKFDGKSIYYLSSAPGNCDPIFFPNNDFGDFVTIGSYLYHFPAHAANCQLGVLRRINLVNNVLTGEWENIKLSYLPPGGKQFFTVSGKVYIITKFGRDVYVHKYSFNEQANLYDYSLELSFTSNTSSSISDLVITNSRVICCCWSGDLFEFEFWGGKNDYAEESMLDFTPPL